MSDEPRGEVPPTRELSAAAFDLFEHAPYACVFVDADGRIVQANARAAKLTGRDVEDLLGVHALDLSGQAPAARMQAESLFAKPLMGQEWNGAPLQIERADGNMMRVRVTRHPVYSAGRFVGSGLTLTGADHAWATASIAGMDERLQAAALASIGNAVMVTDVEGTIAWVNEAFTQMSGYAADEAIGQTPRLLKSGVQSAAHYEQLWATIRDRRIWRGEIVDRHKDGSLYTVWQTITPILDEHGNITHFVAVHEDVTALRTSQGRLQAIFDHALDAIVLFDDEGVVVAANPAASDLTGCPVELLAGLDINALIPEEHRSLYDALWEQFEVSRHTRAWLPIRRADGRLRQVEYQAVADIADGTHLLIARDMTDQHQAEAQQRFQAQVLEAVGDAVIATDLDGNVRYANPAAERLFGIDEAQVLGRPLREALGEFEAQAEIHALLTAGQDMRPHTRQITLEGADGADLTVLATITPYRNTTGQTTGVIAVAADVSDLEATRHLLTRRTRHQAAVVTIGQEAMRTNDPRALAELARQVADDVLGSDIDVALDWASRRESPPSDDDIRIGIGETAALRVRGAGMSSLGDQDYEFLRSLAYVLQTADQRHAAATQLEHLATHDPLTSLANRTLFLDRLEQARATCQRHGGRFAVLFFDLDGFKTINDGLGHEAGDAVLRQIASRLQDIVRPTDTLARFGGDEFAMLCPDVENRQAATVIAQRIHATLASGADTEQGTVSLTASIGIVFGDHTINGDALLRDADTAMYAAKAAGRNRAQVFDAHMQDQARQRFRDTARLQAALDDHRIEVHYQPTIELDSGRIVGVEALARLRATDGTLLTPNHFISVAEETGLIASLGDQVLRRACIDARDWITRDPDFMLAVNISPRQITHHDFVPAVLSALDDTGLAPDRLWLEITESALLAGPGVTTAMQQLRSHGIRFAIDDFGTGYSSLAHLRQMPVDMLKIDRSFVSGLQGSIQDHALVTATIYLARIFGLPATAEGVETQDQLTELTELGCDYAQGYHWSPPTAAATITSMLEHDAATGD